MRSTNRLKSTSRLDRSRDPEQLSIKDVEPDRLQDSRLDRFQHSELAPTCTKPEPSLWLSKMEMSGKLW
ncbi:hypothetical protein CR513_28570, partial [Mucuna pruriens]